MLNAILIDDEPKAIENLKFDLARYCPQVNVLATCLSGKEGMKAINQHRPDIVFLDVTMPHMSGIEMLECLGEDNINFNVIFVTAHSEYAQQAFKYSAVHYLPKPIPREDLKIAVKRVLDSKASSLPQEQLRILIENYKNPYSPDMKMGFFANEGIEFISLKNIMYFIADGNFTFLHYEPKKKLLVTEPLKKIEDKLPDLMFIRIHNSHLINLNHTKKYVRGDGGYVVMDDGKSLNVSRSKKEELIRRVSKK